MVSYTETLLAEQQQIAQLLDCQPKQIHEKVTKLLSEQQSLSDTIQSLTMHLVQSQLSQLSYSNHQDFTYIIDLSTYGWDNIPMKDLINHIKSLYPDHNRIAYTTQGQYALYAGQTKDAKKLQNKYNLAGGGNELLIQ